MRHYNMKNVEIKEIHKMWQSGIDIGKPSGDINYEITVNGCKRGDIMSFSYDTNRFQVTSNSILGEYKAKYFKTLQGAKKFLVNSKERFIPIGEFDFMTGKRKIKG